MEEENSIFHEIFLFVFIHYSRKKSQLIGRKKVNEQGSKKIEKERESARPIYAAWDRVSASELEFDGE